MHRLRSPLWVFTGGQLHLPNTFLCQQLASRIDLFRVKILQILDQQNIGVSAGSDHAHIPGYTEMFRCVDRGHLQGYHRISAQADRVAQDPIHMTVIDQGFGVGIIRAEDEMS